MWFYIGIISLLGFATSASWYLYSLASNSMLLLAIRVYLRHMRFRMDSLLRTCDSAEPIELEFPDITASPKRTHYAGGPLETSLVTGRDNEMDRFILLPIQYPDIWQLYKECLSSFWTVDEVNLEKDVQQYRLMLSPDEKRLLDTTLGFFACADGIVGENLASRFFCEVTIPEARAFYANQILMETIHAEMYSIIIDQLCPGVDEKKALFRSFERNHDIKEKADFALRYITDNTSSFAKRLLGFLIVEGIFFSASFASIFWFKQRGLLPGIIFSNELIARDEAAHCKCCVAVYALITEKLPEAEVHELFRHGIAVEKRFARGAITMALEGLAYTSMENYIDYVANYWLAALGYGPVVVPEPKNPFPFMEMISLPGKGNFFECGISEYAKPEASGSFADIGRTDF